jgi:DNA-3-methyladenine glycosylase
VIAGSSIETMARSLRPLSQSFFARNTVDVARDLLGIWLVSRVEEKTAVVRIVETEAYGGPEDLASHARAGLTPRTGPMFGPPGHAYVYLVYGMHECLNVVAESPGRAGAVLLRAGEPVLGAEVMRRRRGRPTDVEHRLAAGPARLCQALAVGRSLNDHDLTLGQRLWLTRPPGHTDHAVADEDVVAGPRVGVAYAGEWASRPWRFSVRGSLAVSRP